MTLFVVRRQHLAEHCPAEDPQIGATLLNYLSHPNVRQHGVEIRGEAVVEGENSPSVVSPGPGPPPLPGWR
jgi:hypothetical protein